MPSDRGHSLTDRELADLEKRISEVYSEASNELSDEITDYFKSFAIRDQEQLALYEAGEITKQEYTQWRLTQMARGERYQTLRDKIAERYTNANETAIAYVNDATPGIYSLNRNYAAYEIEQAGADVDFTLWDESTVRRLIVEQPDVMPYYPPERAVKRGIDLAYGKQQITKSVTSGILQGKSVYKIADDLQKRIETMNRESAIRSARTAFTAAENAGRQDQYDAAHDMGIDMDKEWLATSDDRVRATHAEASGQRVPYDKPFVVGTDKLMHPGDPSGSPAEIYNCRCTMIAKVRGADDEEPSESFEEWEAGKENAEQTTGTIQRDYDCALAQAIGKSNYDKLCDMVDNCGDEAMKKLWEKYQGDIEIGDIHHQGIAFERDGAIYFNLDSTLNGDSYQVPMQVLFHEAAHAIDYWANGGWESVGMYSNTYNDGEFRKTLVSEVNSLVDNYAKTIKKDFKDHDGDWEYLANKGYISRGEYNFYQQHGEWGTRDGSAPKYSKNLAYDALSRDLQEIDTASRIGISDIVDGVTKGKSTGGFGHKPSYWDSENNKVTLEAHAEMSSATYSNSGALDAIKKYLPQSYEVWHNMVAEMAK